MNITPVCNKVCLNVVKRRNFNQPVSSQIMLIQATNTWLTELNLLCTSDMLHNTITNCNFVDLTQWTENTILIKFLLIKYVSLSSPNAHTTKLWKFTYLIGEIIQIIGNNYYSDYTQLHVGSSPYTSSPTASLNIALRISSVGFETVSILKSTTLIWKLIHYVPKSW